jgi:nucleoside-diphosphate-sugar epimerase
LNAKLRKIVVTGGAGYVGSVLVPKLLAKGHHVKVIDLYIYGRDVLEGVKDHPSLIQVEGDIRNRELLERELAGYDSVIHLACISNDPSFELDPALGRSINYDAFIQLVATAKKNGISRFIYASSSSVYGVKSERNVTEDLPLEPLTDYSRYKALCEEVLLEAREAGFVTLILRPATVCGYSPRLRLDLTVNILTNHAVNNRKIKVFGGQQMRPNIHIEDMTDLYVKTLKWPDADIDGKIFNVGYENRRVAEIAEVVRSVVSDDVGIVKTGTDDHRSYHISSGKIKRELGFVPTHTIEDAVADLVSAYEAGCVPNPMTDIRYYNIKTMQAVNLGQAPRTKHEELLAK